MIDVTTTTTLLLNGLRSQGDESAWRELDARYRPIIEAISRKVGLNEAEAADCAQETLVQFFKAYRAGKYDPARGRLRQWIIGIVKFRAVDIRKAKVNRLERRGHSALVEVPSVDHLERLWEEEQQRVILRHALAELRRTSRIQPIKIEAFELLVWDELPVASVAARLGMNVDEVYQIKHRMIDRLREIIGRMTVAYTDSL